MVKIEWHRADAHGVLEVAFGRELDLRSIRLQSGVVVLFGAHWLETQHP
jgi:hypothetical protein